jgi:hypothetical protein
LRRCSLKFFLKRTPQPGARFVNEHLRDAKNGLSAAN